MNDGEIVARGEGAARIASPDSVRLDFFLGGGMGSGAAVLVGDDLRAPGGPQVARVIPPAPLLWAALGRLAIPALADTAVRVDGTVIRADIGTPVAWRATFSGDTLRRLERVDREHVLEWVERFPGNRVRYESATSRRSLELVITRTEPAAPFDAAIWNPT
ncbi:MAG: hypothetical protein JWO05_549 [Gemmatimonadetes bacterium]|nr:hypothetical protein [Gemmatimonadota bacterium]